MLCAVLGASALGACAGSCVRAAAFCEHWPSFLKWEQGRAWVLMVVCRGVLLVAVVRVFLRRVSSVFFHQERRVQLCAAMYMPCCSSFKHQHCRHFAVWAEAASACGMRCTCCGGVRPASSQLVREPAQPRTFAPRWAVPQGPASTGGRHGRAPCFMPAHITVRNAACAGECTHGRGPAGCCPHTAS